MNESELRAAILEAMEQAQAEGATGSNNDITRGEFEAWLEINATTAQRRLREMADKGILERVMVYRPDKWTGNPRRVQGYRLAKEKPAEAG